MPRFNRSSFIGIAALLSLTSTGVFAANCDNKDIYGDLGGKYFGKNPPPTDNFPFCDSNWESGFVITGIECWATEFQLHAIKVSFSDGTNSAIHGAVPNDQSRHSAITWGPGDKITKMAMWDNYNGGNGPDAVGRITAETSNGQKLDCGSDVGGGAGEFVNPGSGILLGVQGSNSDMVNNLKFLFMADPIDKAELVDAEFKDSDIADFIKSKK